MSVKRRTKALILPPAGPLFAALAGLALLVLDDPRSGIALIAVGVVSLYLLSTPLVARRLLGLLDRYPPLDPASGAAKSAGAIVVLDGGRQPAPPEHGGDTVQPLTLERLRHAARLHRASGVPILVSGNGARELMAKSLADDFGVETRWLEPDSGDTAENARFSARLLRADGIERVIVVTHFWHMPRAVESFRRAGLEAIPAPMGYADPVPLERGIGMFVPSIAMIVASHLAVHELLGAIWYRLRRR